MTNVRYENASFKELDFTDTIGNRNKVGVKFDNQEVEVGERFWGSLINVMKDEKTGFPSEFKLFSAKECLDRLVKNYNRDIRFCIEEKDGKIKLLGMQKLVPNMEYFDYNKAVRFLENRYGSLDNMTYSNGVVTYKQDIEKNIKVFNGDDLKARKIIELPIDNFRNPLVYTAFLRLVCTNGMVAYSNEFIKQINFGNEVSRLHGVFDTYERSNTYGVMEELFNEKCKIQASAKELKELFNAIIEAYDSGAEDIFDNSSTRNLASQYIRNTLLDQSGLRENFSILNISDLNLLDNRTLEAIPTQYTAFDLINILTELRTHTRINDTRKIDKKVGDFLTKKDWSLQHIDLDSLNLNFEKHSIGTFFDSYQRTKIDALFSLEEKEVQESKNKKNKSRNLIVA